jgi:hypothetical protein
MTGLTIGQNLVGYWCTDLSWVVIAGYAPEQVAVFRLGAIAVAHLFAVTPPVGFAGLWSYECPTWILHVGPDTLDKHLRLEDLVYVDRNNHYAGGMIFKEIHTEGQSIGDYQCLLVKGALKQQLSGSSEVFFYLLVLPHHYSSVQHKICPGRWIISEQSHEEIDCRFQSSEYYLVPHQLGI